MKSRSRTRLCAALLSITASLVLEAGVAASLGSYNVDSGKISVSGVSSGGYMAQQFHVAYSDTVTGAGIVAGGPYRCAGGGYPYNLSRAMNQCMDFDDWVPFFGPPGVHRSINATYREAAKHRISSPVNLKNDRVYLFTGTEDQTAPQSIMAALLAYYREFVETDNLRYVDDVPAGHAFVTEDFGNTDCEVTAPPYLNDCDYDTAGELLKHIYGSLQPPAAPRQSSLLAFDQGEFIDDPAAHSLGRTGHVYVPQACADGARCRLHVAFHGCGQYEAAIGDAFYAGAGYNRWAEANQIIILYPQTTPKAYFGTSWPNPYGCWDWWGYTGSDYHVRNGVQIRTVKRMIDRIIGLTTH